MRAAAALVALLVAALLATEITMRPSAADRWVVLGVFAVSTAAAGAVAWGAAAVARRVTRLRTAVVLAAAGSVSAAAVVVVTAALSMFLSAHDLRLVLVALGLGVGLGGVVAGSVAASVTGDLHRLREAVRRVAGGAREVRVGLDRTDELGEVARAFDGMVADLDRSERARARTEAARREFLTAISHDLRTPLTSLRAGVEALEDGVADDPRRYLRAMRADVELLGGLVDDLFLLARIESGGLKLRPERLDLAELVDEAVEAVGPHADRRNIGLRVRGDGAVPLSGSARELGRVLRNLLDNALRHAPRGSQVTVTVSRRDGTARVEVADEGEGFAHGFTEQAFGAFTRHDTARSRRSGGAGLGLAIARGLVTAHDGRIWAEPGPGGRVVVELPGG